LSEVISEYNALGQGKAVMQEYDLNTGKSYILCVVTSLMCRVHEKIPQAGKLPLPLFIKICFFLTKVYFYRRTVLHGRIIFL